MFYETKVSDLSPQRQKDFQSTLNQLGKSQKWGETALTINPISDWENYGFGAFTLGWFQKKVDRLVVGDNITLDSVAADLEKFKEDIWQKFLELADEVKKTNMRVDTLIDSFGEELDELKGRIGINE